MATYKLYKVPEQGHKILLDRYHNLIVPDDPIIPYIEGDGIGVDITPAMRKVVDAAVEKAYQGKRKIHWMEVWAGNKAYHNVGEFIPEETLQVLRDFVVSIKGPLTTPVGGGIRSLNVKIRQELDLYACVRPVHWYGQGSPIKRPELVNYTIWRENTDDIYIGVEWPKDSNEVLKLLDFLRNELGVDPKKLPYDCSITIKPTSEYKSKRLIRKAIRWAYANADKFVSKERPLVTVTLVHKGNIQKFTEGFFMKYGYEVADEPEFRGYVITEKRLNEEYNGDVAKAYDEGYRILLNDRIADNIFQQLLTRTGEYNVLIAQNLNGDYLSDAAAGLVGGLGLAPGSNIGDGLAVFEATHGTAPKYAGKDKVNPGSLILSAAFMLEYMGWKEAANKIHDAIRKTLADGIGTYDLVREWKKEGRTEVTEVSTSGFAQAIVEHM
jgi:isocitrate dehydrogenase